MKLIILGAGGFGREILETISEINSHTNNSYEVLGFLEQGASRNSGKLIRDLPVFGDIDFIKEIDTNEVKFVAAIGRSAWRQNAVKVAKQYGANFINIYHPNSFVSKWNTIGEGAIIQSQCILQCDIKIGSFFVANDNVAIGHDTVIGNFVHVNPNVNIAGGTIIGDDVFIGVKATILTSNIGSGSIIGACSLITKDVPPNMIAKGIPAKFYEMKEKKY